MADGQVTIRTKDGPVDSTARTETSGTGAVIVSSDSDDSINTEATSVIDTTPVSGESIELVTFTLTERSTVYISVAATATSIRRWYNVYLRITVDSGYWQSREDYPTSMFNIVRETDSRENFDVVTLDAGTYTVVGRPVFTSATLVALSASVIIGENTEDSTMAFYPSL